MTVPVPPHPSYSHSHSRSNPNYIPFQCHGLPGHSRVTVLFREEKRPKSMACRGARVQDCSSGKWESVRVDSRCKDRFREQDDGQILFSQLADLDLGESSGTAVFPSPLRDCLAPSPPSRPVSDIGSNCQSSLPAPAAAPSPAGPAVGTRPVSCCSCEFRRSFWRCISPGQFGVPPQKIWSNTCCCKRYRPCSVIPILVLSDKSEVNRMSDLKRYEVHLNLSTTSVCLPPDNFFLAGSPILPFPMLTRELGRGAGTTGQVQVLTHPFLSSPFPSPFFTYFFPLLVPPPPLPSPA